MYDLSECRVRPKNNSVKRWNLHEWRLVAGANMGLTVTSYDTDETDPLVGATTALDVHCQFTRFTDRFRLIWDSEDRTSYKGTEYETITSYTGEVLEILSQYGEPVSGDFSGWNARVVYVDGSEYTFSTDPFYTEPSAGATFGRFLFDFDNLSVDIGGGVIRKLPAMNIARFEIIGQPMNASDVDDPLQSNERVTLKFRVNADDRRTTSQSLRRWKPYVNKTDYELTASNYVIDFDKSRLIPSKKIFDAMADFGFTGDIVVNMDVGRWVNVFSEGTAPNTKTSFYDPPNTGSPMGFHTEKWLTEIAKQAVEYGSANIDVIVDLALFSDWTFFGSIGSLAWLQKDTFGEPLRVRYDLHEQTGDQVPAVIDISNNTAREFFRKILVQFDNALIGDPLIPTLITKSYALRFAGFYYQKYDWDVYGAVCYYSPDTVTKYESDTGELVPTPHLENLVDITQADIDANQDFIDWLRAETYDGVDMILSWIRAHDGGRNVSLVINGTDVTSTDNPILPLVLFPILGWSAPYFNTIKISVFDDVASGDMAKVATSLDVVNQLGYTPDKSNYFDGAVTQSANRWKFKYIDASVDVSIATGYSTASFFRFTDCSRDGFLYLGAGTIGGVSGFQCGGGC